MKKPKTPQTPREIDLYRAKLHCGIGMNALNGEMIPPDGVGRVEYALYCLLHSIEDIAAALSQPCKPTNEKTVLNLTKQERKTRKH